MGTWGCGPFDNDDAANLVAEFMRPIQRMMKLKEHGHPAQRWYNTVRAVSRFILNASGTDILGGPSLGAVANALRRIRSDHGWIDQWHEMRDRNEVRAQLDLEIQLFEDKIRRVKYAAEHEEAMRRKLDNIGKPGPRGRRRKTTARAGRRAASAAARG